MTEAQFVRMPHPQADLSGPEFRAANLAYSDFLRTTDQSTSGDLLSYFGYDFFHDGSISDVSFDPDGGSFSFRAGCENVQRSDHMSLQPAPEFDVRFDDVVAFEWTSGRLQQRIFIGAEIDGLPDAIAGAEAQHPGRFHSLVIDAYGESFQIVFASVCVTPADPGGWAAILADPELQVPVMFE